MRLPIATLSYISLALASPITSRDDDPPTATPPSRKSQAFNIVVNVTNLHRDFSPSIHGTYVNSIHTGAGQSLLGVGSKENNPRTFYINGTTLDFIFAHSTVISDTGTPATPWGISLTRDNNGSTAAHTAHLSPGPGDKGIGLTRLPVPYTFLYPDSFAICNESVAYYGGKKFLVVKQFQFGAGTGEEVPRNCVPVRLIAQCAKLNDLPGGSYSSHEFAYETACYEDVARIDWPKYRPW